MTKSFITDIKKYYFDGFDSLSLQHQFHFASRLGAWNGLPLACKKLDDIKIKYSTPPDNQTEQKYLRHLLSAPQTGRRVAHNQRKPYFEKYPELFGIEKALFRVRHLLTVYNIDVRKDFITVYSTASLRKILEELSSDSEALRILSSFAVNVFYLADILFDIHITAVTANFWYTTGLSYSFDTNESIQLFIYFYTHCIIADSNFYSRSISTENQIIYTKMILRLEEVIEAHFERISLDNKLEFLVATKVIGSLSSLETRIHNEASQSISDNGFFIIEKLNENVRQDRQTFEKSEHRNVLLIMSDESYQRA